MAPWGAMPGFPFQFQPASRQTGGFVPGYGSGDIVPILAEPGEFVVRKSAVEALGVDFLGSLNRYAGGGPVRRDKPLWQHPWDHPKLQGTIWANRDAWTFERGSSVPIPKKEEEYVPTPGATASVISHFTGVREIDVQKGIEADKRRVAGIGKAWQRFWNPWDARTEEAKEQLRKQQAHQVMGDLYLQGQKAFREQEDRPAQPAAETPAPTGGGGGGFFGLGSMMGIGMGIGTAQHIAEHGLPHQPKYDPLPDPIEKRMRIDRQMWSGRGPQTDDDFAALGLPPGGAMGEGPQKMTSMDALRAGMFRRRARALGMKGPGEYTADDLGGMDPGQAERLARGMDREARAEMYRRMQAPEVEARKRMMAMRRGRMPGQEGVSPQRRAAADRQPVAQPTSAAIPAHSPQSMGAGGGDISGSINVTVTLKDGLDNFFKVMIDKHIQHIAKRIDDPGRTT
jgi:hypothetical protein